MSRFWYCRIYLIHIQEVKKLLFHYLIVEDGELKGEHTSILVDKVSKDYVVIRLKFLKIVQSYAIQEMQMRIVVFR